ncbi:MAG: TusE/DsrC/DsvC family sulfur relay protein [Sulfuricaulis sp.]|nr:TusE/DsrC/DsvC family sulfur relay protein [Sulfuricaulis sp.]
MPDILKFIVGEGSLEQDPAGNLLGLGEWSEAIARKLAADLGIQLTPEHWQVINFLRDHHRMHGPAQHARYLLEPLEEKFAAQGGRKYLYLLFPGGAVTQASKIAGLPVPQDSVDSSFGTAL